MIILATTEKKETSHRFRVIDIPAIAFGVLDQEEQAANPSLVRQVRFRQRQAAYA